MVATRRKRLNAPSRPQSETTPAHRGKKKSSDVETSASATAPETDGAIDAMSIRVFCKRHGISPSFFHYLQKHGKGPRTMKLGQRTLVTTEAAADWRREREAETPAMRQAAAEKRQQRKREPAAAATAATA
jgi:hypothetical protein